MSAYDTILTALEGAGMAIKVSGSKARAQCPVHGSHGLTLSIRRFEDRAKLHCFAGCETTEILDAVGLLLRDLYDDPKAPTRPYVPPSPIGDVDHFMRRLMAEHKLEASPEYQQRRAAEIEAARRPRPGDRLGQGGLPMTTTDEAYVHNAAAQAAQWAAELPDAYVGAELLADVERFIGRFVVYPNEAAHVAHVLWIAHTWFMDEWDSTPRIAFLSPEPGSGKSRALEVMEPLVPRAVHAVNVSAAYLFRKVSDEDGAPTILYDEADTVFGPKAKENEDLRGLLNAGHRKGATAGRCEIRGKAVLTVDYPAYCAVALAGLDDLPDTVMTRSVVIRMRRRAPGERIEPWRLRINGPEADGLQNRLLAWAEAARLRMTSWPVFSPGVEDRNADVWEALLAVADLAGGDWPDRARVAAVSLVTAAADRGGSLGVLLLRDLRTVFGEAERLPTEVILERLHLLDESPWADIRGKALDARGLARRLSKYETTVNGAEAKAIKPKVYRDGETTVRGYEAADLADPWSRYLPPTKEIDVTSETNATQRAEPSDHASVASEESEQSQDDFSALFGEDPDVHRGEDRDVHRDEDQVVDRGEAAGVPLAEAVGVPLADPVPDGACRKSREVPTDKAGLGAGGLCLACDLREAPVR